MMIVGQVVVAIWGGVVRILFPDPSDEVWGLPMSRPWPIASAIEEHGNIFRWRVKLLCATSVSIVLMLSSVLSLPAEAHEYTYWDMGNFRSPNFQDPKDGCDYLYSQFYWGSVPGGLGPYYLPGNNKYVSSERYDCGNSISYGGYFGTAVLVRVDCDDNAVFDYGSLKCNKPGERGRANNPLVCSKPDKEAGDPVNITTGKLFHVEKDFTVGRLNIYKYYNSEDGFWVHNYSAHLAIGPKIITFTNSDRSSSNYFSSDTGITSDSSQGVLRKTSSGYTFTDTSNSELYFDFDGKLSGTRTSEGYSVNVHHSDKPPYYALSISDDFGSQIELVEDHLHQLISIASPNLPKRSVSYDYDGSYGRLIATRVAGADVPTSRAYLYESATFPQALTGITDERGVRYVSWLYSGDKVVETQLAGSADLVRLDYPDGLTTRVQYSLGRWVTYRFTVLKSGKEIISIDGQPTTNCPASNSRFTYNDAGQVLAKTDAKGMITTYTYNDRGLEVTRTEASGTSLSRTISTEWDATRFLPVRIIEPNRTTVYNYDSHGRESSRQTTSN
jgi:YD repeat-containing protein